MESSLMRSSPEANSQRRMQPSWWNKCYHVWITATRTTSFTEISSQKTFSLSKTKTSIKLKSSISVLPLSTTAANHLMRSLVLPITLPQRSSTKDTMRSAISGHVVLSHTLSSQVCHPSMVKATKRLWRRWELVNSLSLIHAGLTSLIRLRISSLNFWLMILTIVHQLRLLFNTHGSLITLRNKSMLQLQLMPSQIFNHSELTKNLNKQHSLSLQVNFWQNQRRKISLKSLKLSTRMEMANFQKRKF